MPSLLCIIFRGGISSHWVFQSLQKKLMFFQSLHKESLFLQGQKLCILQHTTCSRQQNTTVSAGLSIFSLAALSDTHSSVLHPSLIAVFFQNKFQSISQEKKKKRCSIWGKKKTLFCGSIFRTNNVKQNKFVNKNCFVALNRLTMKRSFRALVFYFFSKAKTFIVVLHLC